MTRMRKNEGSTGTEGYEVELHVPLATSVTSNPMFGYRMDISHQMAKLRLVRLKNGLSFPTQVKTFPFLETRVAPS